MTNETGSRTLWMAVAAGGAAWWALRRKKTNTVAAPKSEPSPFVPGSHCTLLANEEEIRRWIDEVAAPAALGRIEALGPMQHEPNDVVRLTILRLVDTLFLQTTGCSSADSEAGRLIWKGLFCDVVVQLVVRGLVDEELEDVLRICADPSRDPRAMLLGEDATEPPLPPEPRLPPVPRPRPPTPEPEPRPRPREPAPPIDAEPGPEEPPSNLWHASTRAELVEIGLTRLMEGTSGGAPIKAPSAHLVLLAHGPTWPGLPEARAELVRLARRFPRLVFVTTSFSDTQRHFGKPEQLDALAWVLTAAAPDGRVFSEPIVAKVLDAAPPSPELWLKAIAHASGFVGAPTVWRGPRPQRFGDLVVALASRSRGERPRSTSATTASRPKARRRLVLARPLRKANARRHPKR